MKFSVERPALLDGAVRLGPRGGAWLAAGPQRSQSAGAAHRPHGRAPASAWMRSYSSGVTFVPIDFVGRDAMRGLLAAGAQQMQRTGRTWLLTCGSCMGTESDHCREF